MRACARRVPHRRSSPAVAAGAGSCIPQDSTISRDWLAEVDSAQDRDCGTTITGGYRGDSHLPLRDIVRYYRVIWVFGSVRYTFDQIPSHHFFRLHHWDNHDETVIAVLQGISVLRAHRRQTHRNSCTRRLYLSRSGRIGLGPHKRTWTGTVQGSFQVSGPGVVDIGEELNSSEDC